MVSSTTGAIEAVAASGFSSACDSTVVWMVVACRGGIGSEVGAVAGSSDGVFAVSVAVTGGGSGFFPMTMSGFGVGFDTDGGSAGGFTSFATVVEASTGFGTSGRKRGNSTGQGDQVTE